jgi:hypothetical protein
MLHPAATRKASRIEIVRTYPYLSGRPLSPLPICCVQPTHSSRAIVPARGSIMASGRIIPRYSSFDAFKSLAAIVASSDP